MATKGQVKRKDKRRVVLKTGECQRKNGTYSYRWTDSKGKRHSIYAKTLEELREKEKEIEKAVNNGLNIEARYMTVNDMFDLWKGIKRGLKNNTLEVYCYMYDTYVRDDLGKQKIATLKKSHVKQFYNYLIEEKGLKPSTVNNVHTVLHQILDMAVDDDYIHKNPADNVLKIVKQLHSLDVEKKHALTRKEQELFLDFLKRNRTYSHWYPIFAVMIGTGLRVGEATGLRWCDVDLENGIIDVNHTLVYYSHSQETVKSKCYFNVNTPKTTTSNRQVPMMDFVKEAFLLEKANQEALGIKCKVTIDGYSDFIFINNFGKTRMYSKLNQAISRIVQVCNDEELLKNENPDVLLPRFSCHTLRHTFTTRMCEAGVNVKVIQDILGHQDISTTLNIYADVTKELKQKEFEGFVEHFRKGE